MATSGKLYVMVTFSVPEDFLKTCYLTVSSLSTSLARLCAFSDVRTVITSYVADHVQRGPQLFFSFTALQCG